MHFKQVIKSSYYQVAEQIGKCNQPAASQPQGLLKLYSKLIHDLLISDGSVSLVHTPVASLSRNPTMIFPSFYQPKTLHLHLNTTLSTRRAALRQRGKEVRDVVPRMPVETGPQPLLVEEVSNQTNRTAEHEETVEDTHLEVVLGFLGRESAAAAHEINEADGNATVDVEDEVVLLRRGDRLDSKRVVEQLGAGEVLLYEVLDELDTEIGVVPRLDPVADTGNYGLLDADFCK